jgi:hypothetical protein
MDAGGGAVGASTARNSDATGPLAEEGESGCIVALFTSREEPEDVGTATAPPALEVEQDCTSLTENGGAGYFFRKKARLRLQAAGVSALRKYQRSPIAFLRAGKRPGPLVIEGRRRGRSGAASDGRQSARDIGEGHDGISRPASLPRLRRPFREAAGRHSSATTAAVRAVALTPLVISDESGSTFP